MIKTYVFSSPNGDIPVEPDDLSRPFRITPSDNHDLLTLGDYFEAIYNFIIKDRKSPLLALLSERAGKKIGLEDIHKVLIRIEKHGALYHLSSVEITADNIPFKLSVSAAVSEKGRACLENDFNMLSLLSGTFGASYLPEVYFQEEVVCLFEGGEVPISMFSAEWLEDYHEWHLSIDNKKKRQRLRIWDQNNGHRFASRAECFEIFRQASRILACFYDIRKFRQIFPWHHAAGDFVVRNRNGLIDLKLTTVRRYDPVMVFQSEDAGNSMIALIYFFLNLTIKMRLDKLDGIGEVAWAPDLSVEATIKGFFEALMIKETEDRHHHDKAEDLLSLLKAFSCEELKRLCHSMLDLFPQEDSDDLFTIQAHLEGHVSKLYQSIRHFSL